MNQILSKNLLKCRFTNINIYKKVARRIIRTTFFICICSQLNGFQNDLPQYSARLDSVGILIKSGQYESAKLKLESLDSYFATNKIWDKWYATLLSHYLLSKPSKSFESIEILLQKNLKFVHHADEYYKAKFYTLYTYILSKNGQIYLSTINAEKALKIYTKLNDTTLIASTLKSLGISYSFFNDHESAINYGKAHLDMTDNSKNKKRLNALENLSTYYYYAGKYPQALSEIEKAINLHPDKKSESLLLNKALFLSALKKEAEVFEVISQLELISTKDFKYKSMMAQVYANLNFIDKSMQIRAAMLPELKGNIDKRDYAKELQTFAMQLHKKGDFKTALIYAHEVCQIFCTNYKDEDVYSLPPKQSLIAEAFLMEAILLKAKCLETRYINSNEKQDPRKVIDAYDLSIYNLNMLRDVFGALESKYLMTETMFNIFSKAINFSTNVYKKTEDSFYLNKAFSYSQTSKSFVLKESISKRSEFRNIGIPEALSSKYFELVAKSNLGGFEFLNIKDSLNILEKEMEKNFPRIKNLKAYNPISISEIKKHLKKGQALLHYFFAEDNLTCFTITNNNEFVTRSKIDTSFIDALNKYSAVLQSNEEVLDEKLDQQKTFINAGSKIFETVLSPNLKNIEQEEVDHLIIIPCQHINQISFVNLPLRSKSKWNKIDDLLLSKFAISYLQYTNKIEHFIEQTTPINNSISIGLSYKDYDLEKIDLVEKNNPKRSQNIILNELPYAKKEAEDVAVKIQAKILINKNADFKSVKNSFIENQLIHFAGHCVIDVDNYNNSYIPVYEDSSQSFKLDYSVIQSLNIEPQLVVLSACNTNNGKAINSEGKFSMARVFTETGAKAVLGSNWNTPDKISYKIINLFYDKLLEGHHKAKALQLAQIEFLSNDNLSSPSERIPSNWSNWALFGSDSSIKFSPPTPFYKKWKYLIGTGIILFLILFFGRKYFYKN